MRRFLWPRVSAVVALILAFVLTFGLSAQPTPERFQVHFIDVGQADAILIMNEAKNCKILIDAGDTRYPESSKNFRAYLSEHLPPGSTMDLAIATHPHSDHIGSMQWVLENYRVKTYIDNGQEHPTNLYNNLMAVVRRQRSQNLEYYTYASVPADKEAFCEEPGPKVRILYPQAGLDPDLCEKNQNNCSVVSKVTLRNTSFLFPGDAEREQEEILLEDPQVKRQLNADVLKVGHHGSDTSSREELLSAVSPTWMVISAGERDVGTNKGYKHPKLATIRELLTFAGPRNNARMIDAYDRAEKRWRQVRIWGTLFVTAKDGTVVLSTDGDNIRKE